MPNNSTKRKDGLLLAAIALIGLTGLFLIQTTREQQQTPENGKTVLQPTSNPAEAQAGPQASIQNVPLNLLRESEQPEMNVPFTYELADFSKGGQYLLDPGDGSPLQTFVDGKLNYTYRQAGVYSVSIFAVDGDKNYKMLTVSKQVANKTELKNINQKTRKPVIDY
jgi:hypothetical protein